VHVRARAGLTITGVCKRNELRLDTQPSVSTVDDSHEEGLPSLDTSETRMYPEPSNEATQGGRGLLPVCLSTRSILLPSRLVCLVNVCVGGQAVYVRCVTPAARMFLTQRTNHRSTSTADQPNLAMASYFIRE
jgi:hypothetical protein